MSLFVLCAPKTPTILIAWSLTIAIANHCQDNSIGFGPNCRHSREGRFGSEISNGSGSHLESLGGGVKRQLTSQSRANNSKMVRARLFQWMEATEQKIKRYKHCEVSVNPNITTKTKGNTLTFKHKVGRLVRTRWNKSGWSRRSLWKEKDNGRKWEAGYNTQGKEYKIIQ